MRKFKEKYQVSWDVNNGSTYGTFKSSSKIQARADVRKICLSNVFPGNRYHYLVTRISDGAVIYEVSIYRVARQ